MSDAGEPFAAELEAIGADGRVTFRAAAEGVVDYRTLPQAELVRWSHPVPAKPQTWVLLDDGSRLVTAAEWSGGAAVRLEGDSFIVLSDAWGEVRLPKSNVRGLVFAQRSRPAQRERLAAEVRESAGAKDEVLLTNGDCLVGTVTRLGGGAMALATEAGDAELPLSRVETVIFAIPENAGGSGEPRPQPHDASLAVGLRDGSLLYAKSAQADKDSLKLEISGNVRLAGGTRDDIAFVQSLGGPNSDFVYLSDLEPADYRHVPYLEIPWSYQRDRNVLGEPLAVGGHTYLKGLGMHSAGRLTYRLDCTYSRFEAAVAIDDAAGEHGSVVFGVHLLRDGKWQEAFNSGTIRGGNPPQRVSVDLRGAHAMTLTVDYADRGDERDYADWFDARLVK